MNDSFHVILPSHRTPEFLNNTRSSFRVRLPRRLDFPPQEKWQVALSDVTLGRSDVSWNLLGLSETDDAMYIQGYLRRSSGRHTWVYGRVSMKDVMSMHESMEGMTGLDFMHHVINLSEQAIQGYQLPAGDRFMALPRYTWKVMGGQTVLEIDSEYRRNSADRTWGELMFSKELALKMKWIKTVKDGNTTKLAFGPNLIPQLREFTMSINSQDTTLYGRSTDGNTLIPANDLIADAPRYGDSRVTRTYSRTPMIFLSNKVTWRFVNLNEAFEDLFNHRVRPVYIYANVGESTTVGNVDTDLLRGVPYDPRKENTVYEPERESFRDVRHRFLEIIEVNVAEAHGPLVKFSDKHSETYLTLHFRRGQGIKTE